MAINTQGCGCGGNMGPGNSGESASTEAKQTRGPAIRPGIIDRKVTLLIAAGAAMAANCEPCLNKIVSNLKEVGAAGADIRRALITGQLVKDRPAAVMKQTADRLAGTKLSDAPVSDSCAGDEIKKDPSYKVTLLIAAGAAMGANCEPCLNKVVPDLKEAGVSETDIRRAVEIGQFVKDKPAAIMKEAADVLTGSRLSEKSSSTESSASIAKQLCC